MFDRLGQKNFLIVGPTCLTFCQHVDMFRDDLSFGGSWQHDIMLTFPTKLLDGALSINDESKGEHLGDDDGSEQVEQDLDGSEFEDCLDGEES